ncbi:MAG: biotin--[acetyl-CoA-carboxylase] ligase [Nitrososphaerota archaeon]
MSTYDLLNKDILARYLPADMLDKVIILQSVDSTQNEAKRLNCKPPYYVVAEQQTHGRGRYGRKWYSPEGGLWITFVPKLRWGFDRIHLYSFASVLSIYAVISEYGISSWIKWPNDIFVNDSKLCGILVESEAISSELKRIFLGIGLNVNNTFEDVGMPYKAVSMLHLLGKKVDRNLLLAKIIISLDRFYMNDDESIFQEYVKLCGTISKRVKFHIANKTIEGVAIGISSTGSLVVSSSTGIHTLAFGDVFEQELDVMSPDLA